MRNRPSVSVITIFFNEEIFLSEAIESVFAQSYMEWDYFLVDDGSTDRSSEIARRVAYEHPKVHYVEHTFHQNRGMSASRNLGISRSTGELIAFLDADDVWKPEKLARQVDLFQNDPALGFVYGAPLYWYSWHENAGALEDDHLQPIEFLAGEVLEPPALVSHFLNAEAATPCPSNLIVRRSAAEHVGGFVDEFQGMYEDQAFSIKLAFSERAQIGPSGLSLYRQHSNSCCARTFEAGMHKAARIKFLHWLERYLSDKGLCEVAIHNALRREWQRLQPDSGARSV